MIHVFGQFYRILVLGVWSHCLVPEYSDGRRFLIFADTGTISNYKAPRGYSMASHYYPNAKAPLDTQRDQVTQRALQSWRAPVCGSPQHAGSHR